MKKIFLILLILATGSSSFAQSVNPKAVLDKSIEVNLSSTQMSLLTLDTLDQYFTRASNLTLYKSQDGGYVLGPALYDLGGGNIVPISKATASHFDGIGNAIIVEAWFIVGAKNIVGTADDVSVKIYDAGTDSVPTTLLDSVNLNVADMDTANGITVVPMAANITSSFLVDIVYAGIDDTFGLVSSNPDSADGQGENRARQQLSDDLISLGLPEWIGVNGLYAFDADVMIIPVVDIQSGMTEFKNDLFTLKPVSPNPSNGLVSLEYELKKSTDVSYAVIDASGKTVQRSDSKTKSPSGYRELIDMRSFPSGKYYISFRAGEKILTQRLLIAK